MAKVVVWHGNDSDTAGATNWYTDRALCPVLDTDDDLVIEYDFDPSTECLQSLRLSDDKKTLTNAHPGKTRDEQWQIFKDAEAATALKFRKDDAKARVSAYARELLEEMDWETEKAEEQDFLAGNNNKMVALATKRKKIRDDGNAHRAKVDALADEDAVLAFDARWITKDSVGLGPNRHMDM
tara:strand:+ start:901 stop:1446 length:546 start_codon:yes stop_codon:yes gene_type:complete